ncbi:MAG: hypothetical protein ABR587_03675 [Candidatus Binatia bacterium]
MRAYAIAVLSMVLGASAASTVHADVPFAPDQVRKTRIAGQYLITWRDVSNNEDGFEILRRPVLETEFESRGVVDADVTEFLDDVPAGEIYIYRVRAFNDDGDSDFSNECYINRPRAAVPLYFNVRLIGLTVARIRWSDRSAGERGFQIQRADFGKPFKHLTNVPANTEVYDDYTLKPANSYTYRIRALGRPAICWENSKFTPERSLTTKGGVRIVQVELRGRGKGTVTSDPPRISCGPKDDHCAAEFPLATHVLLTAKPTPRSHFGSWQDYKRCAGTKEPCDVITLDNVTVGAAFKQNR